MEGTTINHDILGLKWPSLNGLNGWGGLNGQGGLNGWGRLNGQGGLNGRGEAENQTFRMLCIV